MYYTDILTKPYATYFGFSTTKLNTNKVILSNQYNMTLMRSQLFVEKFVVQANLILKTIDKLTNHPINMR